MKVGDLVQVYILSELSGTGLILDIQISWDEGIYYTVLCNGKKHVLSSGYLKPVST